MPCYHPLTGYKAKRPNPATGKRSIVFNQAEGFRDLPVVLPCGRCIGCRLEYSRQWAIRCIHEAKLHEQNCTLTLTYAPEHLPPNLSLHKPDHQDFMKAVRHHLAPKKIRFFHCGEYGEKKKRPHFHTIIFGWFPTDLTRVEDTKSGFPQWQSKIVEKLWGKGRTTVTEMNFETAAYIARYVTKKMKHPDKAAHYQGRTEEYAAGSRKPGIGAEYAKKWLDEIYRNDSVMIKKLDGYVETPPPKFYDKILEKISPEMHKSVLDKRKGDAWLMRDHPDSTWDRLKVRRIVHETKSRPFKRTIE